MAFGTIKITRAFETYTGPFMDKILANNIHNINLSNLRNTLFSKPLSGEVRIPDTERLRAEVEL